MNANWRHWTDEDEQEMLRLAEEGLSTREMAQRLNRTPRAIQSRFEFMGVRRRRPKVRSRPSAPIAPAKETVRISRAEVPPWYALGWRFFCFDGEACIFEWPHASAPVRPELEVRLAA